METKRITFACCTAALARRTAYRLPAFDQSLARTGSFVVATLLALAGAIAPEAAWAQATAGRASSIVIPVVAKTSSFETEVFVRNPGDNAGPIDVDVLYYNSETNNLPDQGLVTCAVLNVPLNATVSFKLGTQCTLTPGSHFGMMVLRDHATQKINAFAAFSRVQHVIYNSGFSIEGFPEHTFSGRTAGANGLKRIAGANPATNASPGYQPNCFVGSLGETVSYSISVREPADDTVIAGTTALTGTLQPYQLVRYLDILDKSGFTPGMGDKPLFRVRFQNTTNSNQGPALIGFCTQQENQFFGADFRIAKSDDEANITKLLLRCRGTSDAACTTLTSPATYSFANGTNKQRWSMFIHHPDFVRCDIVGPQADKLEIQLYAPPPSGQAVGPVVAGGTDQSFFYYETGPRNAVVNSTGFQTFWTFDVSAREGTPPTYPADYGIRCRSGSGIHVGSGTNNALADDF